MIFFIYQIILFLIFLLSPLIIIIRILKKKEHKKRFIEKFCIFSEKRVKGNLIWFHGSSVGEILSIIPLLEKLEKNKSIEKILVTSSTLSSSFVLKKFKLKKTIHHFFPIDFIFFTKKFLEYWKPKVAIFIESEIWPCMFLELNKRSVPLCLLNARITKKTYKRWNMIKKFSHNIFNKITISYPQNSETFNYLKKLNTRKVQIIGNLKFAENEQDKLKTFDDAFKNQLKKKKIWCASSTHKNEEIVCARIHQNLKKKYQNLLTIIIPRHIHRTEEIKKELEEMKLNVVCRSEKKKITKNTDIYIVNTYGETRKFYQITNTVFLGGSLVKHGGQNPIEAARLGAQIIYGPNVDNFKDVYKLFDKKKISKKIKNVKDFTSVVDKSILNSKNSINKFKEIKKIGDMILNKTTVEINNLIKNEIKKTKFLGF